MWYQKPSKLSVCLFAPWTRASRSETADPKGSSPNSNPDIRSRDTNFLLPRPGTPATSCDQTLRFYDTSKPHSLIAKSLATYETTAPKMSGFGDYPPNMAPQDALIVRQEAEPDHAVVPYTGEDLARPRVGPANPFKDESAMTLKRKNVLTGRAEETYISEHTFRSKHRAVERKGGPEREYQTGAAVKEENARIRSGREGKGDATIVEGDGAYLGPWARYRREEYEVVGEGEALASDEEYEEVTDDGEDDVVESGTVLRAPEAALARRKEVEAMGEETTTFHGAEETDYQGRTYMHVPQDLDVDLRKEAGSVTNYIPKKQIHAWKDHTKAVTALRFFPGSGHLLLSASADSTVKIWDVYHERSLLRTFSGHSKAVSDATFNNDGTRFLSASFDRQIKLWDTETGTCLSRFSTGKTPHVVRFNPSAEHAHEFVAGMSDKKIVQWDTRAGNEIVQEYGESPLFFPALSNTDPEFDVLTITRPPSRRHQHNHFRRRRPPLHDDIRRQVPPRLGLQHPRPHQVHRRALHVPDDARGAAPERKIRRLPVVGQSDCRLRRQRQVPAEPQEVVPGPQQRRHGHRRQCQSRRSVLGER